MNDSRQTPRHRWRHLLQELALMAGCVAVSVAFAFAPEPALAPPPDFSVLDGDDRKQAFFDYLSPLVDDVNAAARRDRDFVAFVAGSLAEREPLSLYTRARLEAVAARYEVELGDGELADDLETLRLRTGAVPRALVLVQAAKESGWGTSRFATEGNNLFGQRCYEAGCGLKPRGRPADAGWGVARFDSIRESLESYVRNLNTHPNYREFRLQRREMRRQTGELSGLELAAALETYSERGEAYVAEVQSMIRQNGLE